MFTNQIMYIAYTLKFNDTEGYDMGLGLRW